jgi:hypothetical protein
MVTWAWDELEGSWTMGKPSRVRVGEQDAAGWVRQEDQGRVKVFRSDRGHLGLEVEALTAYDAQVVAWPDCADYREALD